MQLMPGMTLTPFEAFFQHEFPRLLDQVGKDGTPPGTFTGDVQLRDTSWDRRAAWLIWSARSAR